MNENPITAKEQYELAEKYWKGEDALPQDWKKAAFWYDKAAEQGYKEAQYNLGLCYLNGEGVPKDLKMAVYWFTRAVEQGYAKAQYNLGICYYKGDGVPQSRERAVYWITKAAEKGDEKAKNALAELNRTHSTESPGCYIATCVYGSYDCPEVWTLRRFRDNELSNLWLGRQFIRIYYAVSPKIVELFGNKKWFSKLWKPIIDKIVCKLQNGGAKSA